jgi:hypothetical protein
MVTDTAPKGCYAPTLFGGLVTDLREGYLRGVGWIVLQAQLRANLVDCHAAVFAGLCTTSAIHR